MGMKLFKIEDYSPVPTEEAYAIKEFSDLLTLQYNKGKGDTQGRKRYRGIKELEFIFFFVDYRSEFAKYAKEERRIEALHAAGLDENYKISKELTAAITQYRKLQETRPIKLLNAARQAVDKMTEYFNSVELTIEGPNGNLIPNPDVQAKDVMANLSNLAKVLKGLDDLEDQIKTQEMQTQSLRGEAEPGRLK